VGIPEPPAAARLRKALAKHTVETVKD